MSQEFVNMTLELFDASTSSGADARNQPRLRSYCKGYRVVGVPPGDVESARCKYLAAQALSGTKALDENEWLMKALKKPVNRRPYELRAGAEHCAQLAIKALWQRVEIVELGTSSRGRNAPSARGTKA